MIPRLLAAACALALAMGAAQAHAQAGDDDDDDNQPIVVQIQGDCAVAIGGRVQPCQGLAYMAFPANHRMDFTALTPDGGWAFSGQEDRRSDDGTYTLLVDSVLRAGTDRISATGQCVMLVGDDGATVKSLDCRARTAAGVLTLKATGMADLGDDDDDDDSSPDNTGKG